jgi:hypothetical protein
VSNKLEQASVAELLTLARAGQRSAQERAAIGVIAKQLVAAQEHVSVLLSKLVAAVGGDPKSPSAGATSASAGGGRGSQRGTPRTPPAARAHNPPVGERMVDYMVKAFGEAGNAPLAPNNLLGGMRRLGWKTTSKDPLDLLKVYINRNPQQFVRKNGRYEIIIGGGISPSGSRNRPRSGRRARNAPSQKGRSVPKQGERVIDYIVRAFDGCTDPIKIPALVDRMKELGWKTASSNAVAMVGVYLGKETNKFVLAPEGGYRMVISQQ